MTELRTDHFDARLVELMTAYGDRAVSSYDAATIARAAVVGHPAARFRSAFWAGPRMRFVLLATVLALLALAAAMIAGSQHPSPIGDSFASPTAMAWSPDGALLAFVVDVADSHRDGQAGSSSAASTAALGSRGRPSHPEVWIESGDGGKPRRLATLEGDPRSMQLIWTPDGRSVIVAAGAVPSGSGPSKILEVALDASPPRTLVDAGADGISISGLSPAGDRLLYLRSNQARADLFVLDLASATSNRLTTSGTVCCSGSWSPDGTSIMYADGVTGGTPGPDAATRLVAADGSSEHRLGPCCDVGWSTDGPRAFFQSDSGPLYSAAEDGTDVRAVPGGDAPYGWVPSPMGSGFVAVTSRGLEIVHPGGAPTSLTTDPGDSDPAWSPDGAWIAFSGIRSGVGGLFTVRATGGEARLVTSYAYTIGDPWRPGAGRDELTVVRDRAIVTVGPEGTGLRDLVARTTIAGKPKVVDAGASTRIVIGTDGPDQDVYRVPLRSGRLELLVENRSSVPWVISGGLTEKNQYCRVVSGPSAQPCTVAPGATVAVAPSGSFSTSALEIGLSPAGTNYFQVALPVILDPVAEP